MAKKTAVTAEVATKVVKKRGRPAKALTQYHNVMGRPEFDKIIQKCMNNIPEIQHVMGSIPCSLAHEIVDMFDTVLATLIYRKGFAIRFPSVGILYRHVLKARTGVCRATNVEFQTKERYSVRLRRSPKIVASEVKNKTVAIKTAEETNYRQGSKKATTGPRKNGKITEIAVTPGAPKKKRSVAEAELQPTPQPKTRKVAKKTQMEMEDE